MHGKSLKLILAILLSIVSVEFLSRGPLRVMREGQNWNDFLSPYIQSKAWLHGRDPYSTRELINMWPSDNPRPAFVDRDIGNGNLQKLRGIPTPYPITTFVILSPFAALPWKQAEILWIALNTAFALFSLFGLLFIYGGSPSDIRGQTFLTFGLGLAPIHTGLATANPVILVIGFSVLALLLSKISSPMASGLFVALAVCIKPPIGICVLLYFAVRRQWLSVVTALVSAAVVILIGVIRMDVAQTSWLESYVDGSRHIFSAGALADFSGADPVRFNMIDLRILIYALFGKTHLVEIVCLICGAVLAAIWLYKVSSSNGPAGLLEFSALCVLSLLPIYHRFYDASLLIWPLYWSLTAVGERLTRAIAAACILPFLVPGAVLLDQAVQHGWIPRSIAQRYWWDALVMPHETWSLLFLSVLLLYSIRAKAAPAADLGRAGPARI
jgi:hypothetical protein